MIRLSIVPEKKLIEDRQIEWTESVLAIAIASGSFDMRVLVEDVAHIMYQE